MGDQHEPAVRAVTSALLRAVNASDLEAVMAVWDDQGVLMPPGHRSVHGRAAISDYFHRLFAGSRFEFVFTSSQGAIEGNLAVERVDDEASAWALQGDVAQRDHGKGIHVYVSVEPFHLFRYLDEQAFRFNERSDNDGARFAKMLQQIAGRRLTFEQLIGHPQ